jgi:hypothetical protein
MRFDGAVVKVQRLRFAIVIVKPQVLKNPSVIQCARVSCNKFFPGIPIILLSKNSNGRPTYQGRMDIVRFLTKVHPSRIPWKTYTAS